jgi:hypothetical protein
LIDEQDKFKINVNYSDDFAADYSSLKEPFESKLIALLCIIEETPIPIENKKWHELKDFYVENTKTGNIETAFIAALKFRDSDTDRITYMFKYNDYNDNTDTHYIDLIFLNCRGHKVLQQVYSDSSDNDQPDTENDDTLSKKYYNPFLDSIWY